MNVISYNVEGLLSKLYNNSFFKNLEDFYIVCLLETFIDTDVFPDDLLPSFIRYFTPALKLSAHGRWSGGAVVFVKKSLKDFCEKREIEGEIVWTRKNQEDKKQIATCRYERQVE